MIPKRYEAVKYEDVPEKIRNLFEKIMVTRRGIYIHGNVGSGKTHIAYSLMRRWDETHVFPAIFWNTIELFREIKDEFDRTFYDKKNVCKNLMESRELLFLDDIGAEKPTEFVQETFYLLINKRYNDMRPIIFTSNYSIAELSARIGDRIASRIVEMCDIVNVSGADRRLT